MDTDPWNWSVAEVQHFFREDAIRFVLDRVTGRLPPDTFTAALAENDVDGASLLDTLDAALLRNEFGITSLCVRGTVLHCIHKLRSLSEAHRSLVQTSRPRTPASLLATPILPTAALPETPADVLPSTETAIGEYVRPGEVQVQDIHGRKRRKLDIAGNHVETDAPAKPAVPTPDASGYLPDAAVSVDELFFGPTSLGHQIMELVPLGDVLADNTDPETANDSFQFTTQGKTLGESSFVYARTQHFLSNAERVELKRRDRDAVAILPYTEALQNQTRSAVVVQAGRDDNYIATREQASLLQSGYDYSGLEQQSTGEWDFLLQKYKASDSQELPAYGDSETGDAEITDSEGASDSAQQAAEENEELLEQSHTAEIVDKFIEAAVSEWQGKTLPRLEEKRAWTVWKKMKQSRTMRDVLIESARAKIERFSQRLQKLKQELVEREWNSDSAVTKACANLEPTIEDCEEQKWMVLVWQRRKEPAHTVQHKSHSGHALQTPTTGNGNATRASFAVHPDDRMSVSPTPVMHVDEGDVNGGATNDQGGNDEDEQEEFRTPLGGSPLAAPTPDGFEASDEMSLNLDEPDHGAASEHSETEMQGRFSFSISPLHGSTPLRNSATRSSKSLLDESPAPARGEGSEEELASPSTFFPPTIKQQPQTPIKTNGKFSTQPIDLTMSSDSAEALPISKRRPRGLPKGSVKKAQHVYHDRPGECDAEEVDSWDYSELAARQDRNRVLIKLLKDAGPKLKDELHARLISSIKTFESDLRAAIQAHIDHRVNAQDPEDLMMHCARIAMAWHASKPEQSDGKVTDLPWREVRDGNQIPTFISLLRGYLKLKTSKLFVEQRSKPTIKSDPSSVTVLDSSDASPQDTPHKQRKKLVQESQAGKKMRSAAHDREKRYREALESQAQESSQVAALDPSDPSKSDIPINPGKKDHEDPIYIHPHIAKKMKGYQIDGVRFLWHNITATTDDEEPQGCLLAHTMGLGKTMQTIALLVAVAEASRSKQRGICNQLPAALRLKGSARKRQVRILILCPPSLIQNWRRELAQWAPKTLSNVFVVEASSKTGQMRALENWHAAGGVLLIGYAMFRTLIARKTAKQQQDLDGDLLDDILLRGPEIVVADEAQSLKNPAAGLSQAAGRLVSHTRIALTGTPMSNDVDEIYALISWVAPGYLGEPLEFKAQYAEPIVQGLYGDSSRYEKRKSLMKLQVLHHEIGPKVNRADITVLRGSLKPKIEFVITVPLTEMQTVLYKRCIAALLVGGDHETASQVTIFSWLGLLMLLTNHPAAFRRKLLRPTPPRKSKKAAAAATVQDDESPGPSDAGGPSEVSAVTGEGAKDPEDENLFTLGFTQAVVDEMIRGFDGDPDPKYSAKMDILLSILHLSRKCGDKVLIFSGSIPTMDYLNELFAVHDLAYGRIDGSTPMPRRTEILEDFHSGRFDVMIVSTRAGGVGLNIQGANRVVIMDYGFNPTWEEQAIGRAYRLGQEKPVFVYRFVAGGTFETNIRNKQLFKTSLAQRVVDKKNPQRHAQRNTREYLYDPKPVRREDVMKWSGKDPKVLDKLLERYAQGETPSIRSILTTETLEEEAEDEPLNEEERKEVDEEIQLGRTKQKGKRGVVTAANGVPLSPGAVMGPPVAAMAQPARLAAPSTQPVRQQHSHAGPSTQRAAAVAPAPPSTAPARNKPPAKDAHEFQPLLPQH